MTTLKDNIWSIFNHSCHICRLNGSTEIGICESCLADLSIPASPCHFCAMPKGRQSMICNYCQNQPQAFDSAWCALLYQFPVNAIFAQIKQGKNPTALHWIGRLMADMHPKIPNLDEYVLVPVPMHPLEQLKRGFNQTDILSRYLAQKTRLSVNKTLITKAKRTAHQAELNRSGRLSNLEGSFKIQSKRVPDKVILVDDVLTTGATAHTLAKLLKSGGTKAVHLWTFCRAL